jgi:hypothetical protein
MEDTKVFDKKLAACLSEIKTLNIFKDLESIGAARHDQSWVLDFFNRQIAFDGNDFVDMNGDGVTTAVKVALCNYLMKCQREKHTVTNKMVTFREFSNAGPLFSRFSENTGKIISTNFSGQLDQLKSRCQSIGGTLLETESYDLSVKFQALNKIPIFLNFNDADDMMPANAVFLFHDDAETYLDLDSLALLCTYLTGLLIQG